MTVDIDAIERRARDTRCPYTIDMTTESILALTAVVRCASAMLAKLDECQPHIDAAFALRYVHGMRYDGPQYGIERDALRDSLQSITG